MPNTLNVDRAAVLLIRRFGDESAVVAFARARYCEQHDNQAGASEWRRVLRRVIDLHFRPAPPPRNRLN